MKPIREYLSQLPAPYNTLALSVVDENFYNYKAEVDSLEDAVSYMCDWKKTPQLEKFWMEVWLWCFNPNNRQLPPIPAVEVSPEAEQPNKANELFTIIEQVRKGLIDLEQENTQLKAQLAELLSNPK
jgi:hypothetical protein